MAAPTSMPRSMPARTNSTSAPEPPWEQANPLEVFNITSPQSTMSSSGFGLDVAPLRWFDLLAGDASANDEDFSMDLLNWREAAAQIQDPTVVANTSVRILTSSPDTINLGYSNYDPFAVNRKREPRDGSRGGRSFLPHNRADHAIQHPLGAPHASPGFGGPLFPTPSLDVPNLVKEPWQVAYQLQAHETPIFRRFVDRVALWMDLLDPMK